MSPTIVTYELCLPKAYENGVACYEVGYNKLFKLYPRMQDNNGQVAEQDDAVWTQVEITVTEKNETGPVVEAWNPTFWQTVGTYTVKYAYKDQSKTGTLRIVQTDENHLAMDDDGFLVITCANFVAASLAKHKDHIRQIWQAAGGGYDWHPPKLKINGNPHSTYDLNTKTTKSAFDAFYTVTVFQVGDDVTHIGTDSFRSFQMTTLTLPSSIQYLGPGISRCPRLTTLDLSKTTIRTILPESINENWHLQTILLPPTVVRLESRCFQKNDRLSEIDVSNVTHFGEYLFFVCHALKKIDIRSMVDVHPKTFFQAANAELHHIVVRNDNSPFFDTELPQTYKGYGQNWTGATIEFVEHVSSEILADFSRDHSQNIIFQNRVITPPVGIFTIRAGTDFDLHDGVTVRNDSDGNPLSFKVVLGSKSAYLRGQLKTVDADTFHNTATQVHRLMDTKAPGTFIFTYSTSSSSSERTVTVVGPRITLPLDKDVPTGTGVNLWTDDVLVVPVHGTKIQSSTVALNGTVLSTDRFAMTTPGTFTFEYVVTDSHGNISTSERVFTVTGPIITLPPTINILDEFDLCIIVALNGDPVPTVPGDFRLTYSVNNSDSENSIAQQVITVVDTNSYSLRITNWYENAVACFEVKTPFPVMYDGTDNVINATDNGILYPVIYDTNGNVIKSGPYKEYICATLVEITVTDNGQKVTDAWEPTFWNRPGTYTVEYALQDQRETAELRIVDTRQTDFTINADNVLVIECEDFQNASLKKHERYIKTLWTRTSAAGDFPTNFQINGNAHHMRNGGSYHGLTPKGTRTFQDFTVDQILFGDGVAHIGNRVVYDTKSQTLELPSSVKYIGAWIHDNTKLESIDLSRTKLGALEEYGIWGNIVLRKVSLPPSLVRLNNNCFTQNETLSEIDVSNVTNFGSAIFKDCRELRKIDVRSMTSVLSDTLSASWIDHIVVESTLSPLFEAYTIANSGYSSIWDPWSNKYLRDGTTIDFVNRVSSISDFKNQHQNNDTIIFQNLESMVQQIADEVVTRMTDGGNLDKSTPSDLWSLVKKDISNNISESDVDVRRIAARTMVKILSKHTTAVKHTVVTDPDVKLAISETYGLEKSLTIQVLNSNIASVDIEENTAYISTKGAGETQEYRFLDSTVYTAEYDTQEVWKFIKGGRETTDLIPSDINGTVSFKDFIFTIGSQILSPIISPIISPISSSYSGGDPYVYPLFGPCYKLPNCDDIYRLYQDDDVVINAQVSVASPEIQTQIRQVVVSRGGDFLCPVSTEAYFYSQIFIASRTSDDQVFIDLEQKQTDSTGNTFRVGPYGLSKDSRPYEDEGASYVDIPIRWGKDTCLSIGFSRNPQIRNGVRLQGTCLVNGTGLLVKNFRAKFFRLPNISNKEAVSIPSGRTRLLTKRGTRGYKQTSIDFVR